MAYGYRRRRMRRRGGVFATRYRRRRLATFTRAIVNRVAELKAHTGDTGINGIDINMGWGFRSFLAGIDQGTTASTRIGNQIYVRKIEVMINILPYTPAFEGQTPGHFCRLILYRNKQTNGSLPDFSILFNKNMYNSLRNVPNIRRIVITRDYMHSFQRLSLEDGALPGPTITGTSTFQWTIYPRRKIQYSANTSSIADILSNDIGIGWSGSHNGCCRLDLQWQVWFNDV